MVEVTVVPGFPLAAARFNSLRIAGDRETEVGIRRESEGWDVVVADDVLARLPRRVSSESSKTSIGLPILETIDGN